MDINLTKTSCRVCFTQCTPESINASIVAELYHEVVGYKIYPEDVPQKICLECLEFLMKLQEFKEECHKSEEHLQKIREAVSMTQDSDHEIVGDDILSKPESDDFQPNPSPDSKEPESSIMPSESTQNTTKKVRPDQRKWRYEELVNYLNENRIDHSDVHSFILKYDETTPNPEHLPPNEDSEVYETKNDFKTVVACTYCSFRGTLKLIKRHCKRNGRTHKRMFRCSCCREFHCLDFVRNHIAFSANHNVTRVCLRKLECNFCRFTCNYEMTMEKHCKKMHPEQVLQFCVVCGTKFYCDDLKLQHLVFRCNGGDLTVQIPFKAIWGKEIPFDANLIEDKGGKRKVICELCGATVYKSCFQEHIKKYHEETRYYCDICGQNYLNKPTLVSHMKRNHMQITETFSCPHCDRVYNSRNSRHDHIKKHHTSTPYPFACDLCDKRFVQRWALTYHRACHLDVRNLPCSMCDAVFKTKKHLSTHKQYVHSTRSFPCPTCFKRFRCRPNLKRHQRTHEPNKYSCPVCSQSFAQNHSLRKHAAKNHPEYELPPLGIILDNMKRKN